MRKPQLLRALRLHTLWESPSYLVVVLGSPLQSIAWEQHSLTPPPPLSLFPISSKNPEKVKIGESAWYTVHSQSGFLPRWFMWSIYDLSLSPLRTVPKKAKLGHFSFDQGSKCVERFTLIVVVFIYQFWIHNNWISSSPLFALEMFLSAACPL